MKKIIYVFLIFLFVFVLFGCKSNNTPKEPTKVIPSSETDPAKTKTSEVTNTGIEIENAGKVSYLLGESFDVKGYTIKLLKSDGSFESIAVTNEMVTIDMSKAGRSKGVIKYLEFEVEFSITILKVEPMELNVTKDGRDYYWYKQSLDLSDYEFTVTYNDGSTKVVDNSLISTDFSGFSENETDDGIEVEITCSITIDGVTLNTKIKVINYSEWIYEEIEIAKQDEETIDYVNSVVLDYIPTEVDEKTSELTLMDSSYLPYKGYVLAWNSSNSRIITPLGVITPDEDDYSVTLTMTLRRGTKVLLTKEFMIKVKGLGPVEFPALDRTKKQVFAYSYNGNFISLTDASARKINFYNYCFANIGADYKITLDGLTHLDEVLSYRRKYHIRVILSIKDGPWQETASNDENCVKFAMSVVDVIKKYHFDGIDIDWEFPPKIVGAPMFTNLIKTLREYMDIYTPGKFLTAALIGGGSVSNVKQYYECDKANEILDYAHLMTYDLNNSGIASHHTNPLAGRAYSAQGSIGFYHDAGFDYEKLVIGCAFYGKRSELSNPYSEANKNVLNASVLSTSTITYSSIKLNFLSDPTYVEYFDEKCGAYYLTNGKYFITYDNAKSIKTKGELVQRYNLGGLMFWDLGSDNTFELLGAVNSVISDINNGRL